MASGLSGAFAAMRPNYAEGSADVVSIAASDGVGDGGGAGAGAAGKPPLEKKRTWGKAKGATAEAMVPPPSSYDSLPEVLACPPCGCRSACATTAAAHARRQSVSAGVHRSRDRSSER